MVRHHLSIGAPLLVVALAALGVLGCASEQVVEAAKQPAAAAAATAGSPSPSPSPSAPSELASWSNRRLAAQLCFCSVPAPDPLAGRRWARMGIGGIVILGGGARSSIGQDWPRSCAPRPTA